MALSFEKHIKSADTVDKISSMILFGNFGTGKTWFGASATRIEEYAPVLIVDVEGSAAGVGRRFPDVDVIKADTHAKFESVINELLTEEHQYKTVMIDTLNVAQNNAEAQFRKDHPNDKFAVYADLKQWTIDLGRKMHNADFLGIMIAHSQVDKDENTGRMLTTVKIAGSAKTDLPAIPDIVAAFDTIKDEDGKLVTILRVGRSESVATKNRFGLPDTLFPAQGKVAPDMLDLQTAIIQARADEQKEKE